MARTGHGPARRSVRSVDAMSLAELHDQEALDEIELCADLVIAATEHDGPLSLNDLDRFLGVPDRSE
jgi:hypothetical protein